MLQVVVLAVSAAVLAVLPWTHAQAQVSPGTQPQRDAEILEGRKLLDYLMANDPKQVCKYVKCVAPVQPDQCPKGTHYMKSVIQMGCCDGCVQFMAEKEWNCCGGIDPRYADYGGFCDLDHQNSADCTREVDIKAVIQRNQRTKNSLASNRCDYGLCCSTIGSRTHCEPGPDISACEKVRQTHDDFVNSPHYSKERDDYLWLPECSTDGTYAPKQCKGPLGESKRCVCVDPNGKTIYGSAFEWQKELHKEMNCACSRRRWELERSGENIITLHCKENGNYEELQCQKGLCACVDPLDGKPYGLVMPEKMITFLSCYNKTVIGEQYLRRCESKYVAHEESLEYMAEHGVSGTTPNFKCDPDGSYNGLIKDTSNKYYCVDKYGVRYPGSVADERGCRCTRDLALLEENNRKTDLECDGNDSGVYNLRPITTERAFCVDEDGVRSGPQVKPEFAQNLGCEAAKACQEASDIGDAEDFCERACSDCDINDAYIS
ncbi:uncharacterized protein LOC143034341 [Oratosquilla oratoria]|uniref:uncharacterized protein LOC143034341 n=1 Tax=Oratosquilla oratoria TaxID=337810 RepID=UPI003F7712FF